MGPISQGGERGVEPTTAILFDRSEPIGAEVQHRYGLGGGHVGAADGTASGAVVELVDASTAVDLLAARDDLIVIDVRTPEEFGQGYLQGAELLDLTGGQFEAEVGELDCDARYLLCCRTGARSGEAASIMAELGFTEVIDAGGFDELAAQGAATAP